MLVTSIAHADSDDLVGRSVVLAPGELEVNATLAFNMKKTREWEQYSLSPDVWFGVTRELTLGLVHSARSISELDANRPYCVSGCDPDYLGGLDARYRVHRFVAARVRLLARDIDPWKPAATLGALVRWHHGRFGITADPYLRLGLQNRDLGNRATLLVPVQLAVQPTCKWVVGARLGYDSAIEVWRDGWRGQASVFAGAHPIEPLEISVEYGFRALFGPVHDGTERVLMISVGWRQDLGHSL
jgi:hypothetical protein